MLSQICFLGVFLPTCPEPTTLHIHGGRRGQWHLEGIFSNGLPWLCPYTECLFQQLYQVGRDSPVPRRPSHTTWSQNTAVAELPAEKVRKQPPAFLGASSSLLLLRPALPCMPLVKPAVYLACFK